MRTFSLETLAFVLAMSINSMGWAVETSGFSEDNRLTLEKSIELALKQATTALKAENDVRVSGAQLLQSYGQFLPNLSAATSYSYSNGNNYLTTASPTLVSSRN